MSRNHQRQKKIYKEIASRRIRYLFQLAEDCALQRRVQLADRYVILARKLSMKYLVPIPQEYKRRFCTHCYHYLFPAVTCRVRIHRGMIIIYCSTCKKFTRIPLHSHSTTEDKK